ncbi:MAG: allantoinase AllB [Ignavibacteriales bacterium]|nr:allantoinase AllB [Ignavibacteriales bacterium]MCB9210751.1 allantoinase AllB [Ignavibacteriales bacterium]MCB9260104.1 allantoinase AllB [Ignavibacteriales bacterium]
MTKMKSNMNEATKILTNIFINTSENNFTPVNIYFTDKIEKIERVIDKEFSWQELKDEENKEKIINHFPQQKFQNDLKIIDGKYNIVIPGTIDPHVHFDTPGFEFREDFEHASTAAAFGGVTTIIDMPCTSLPPVTSAENFKTKLETVKNKSLIDFAFWGGICRNDLENGNNIEKQINELNELGVAGYKTYLISGMETFKDLNLSQMKSIAEVIKKTGKPQAVHAEDKFMIESKRQRFKSANQNSWEYYCLARNSDAEEKAILDMISVAKKIGQKVHIVHLSTEAGLNAIKKAQQEGVKITSETCPHYLQFTQDSFLNEKIRNYLKTAPPVKMNNDLNALWSGLKDGTLSFVTTDHAGCNPEEEKVDSNFWNVYGGIPGVEHRVPYLFSEGFLKNRLTFEQTQKLLSENVAKYFNIDSKGKIENGYDADFAIINLWDSEIIKSENMHSKGKYTPFEGLSFNCKIEKTILRGNVVMDFNGNVAEKIGYGKFLKIN